MQILPVIALFADFHLIDLDVIDDLCMTLYNGILSTWNALMSIINNFLSISDPNATLGVETLITSLGNVLRGPAYALFMLAWFYGIFKQSANLAELKRPEVMVKHLIRGGICIALISKAVDIVKGIWNVGYYLQQAVAGSASNVPGYINPNTIINAVSTQMGTPTSVLGGAGGIFSDILLLVIFLIIMIGAYVAVFYCAFSIFTAVFRRFFMFSLLCCLAPLGAAGCGCEETQKISIQFVKNVAATSIELMVTTVLLRVFTVFAGNFASQNIINMAAGIDVVSYFNAQTVPIIVSILCFIFTTIILNGAIKGMNSLMDSLFGLHGV